MLFICENNQYALSTSYWQTTSVNQVARRAAGYEVLGVTIDGNDMVEVYLSVQEAVERARAGDGPTLIEAMTYRWGQRSMRTNLRDPPPEKKYNDWVKRRDPVKRIEKTISSEKAVPPKRMKEIANNIESELEFAIEFGKKGEEPTVEEMVAAVYSPHEAHQEPGTEGVSRELAFTEALNEAMRQKMASEDSVFLMGGDVGAPRAAFFRSRKA